MILRSCYHICPHPFDKNISGPSFIKTEVSGRPETTLVSQGGVTGSSRSSLCIYLPLPPQGCFEVNTCVVKLKVY